MRIRRGDSRRVRPAVAVFAVGLVSCVLAIPVATSALDSGSQERARFHSATRVTPGQSVEGDPSPDSSRTTPPDTISDPPRWPPPVKARLAQLPQGGRTVFPRYRLVAYYGTAGTASMGVLGSAPPDLVTTRLERVARQYRTPHRKVQLVYELIVSVADRSPGPDGNFSHFIDDVQIRSYIAAAKRHKALLVLDIQPGQSQFLPTVRRVSWALAYPFVGIALDPEWRMGGGQVPGRVLGHVGALEVNQVADYVAALTRRHRLPQKVFVLHEFKTSMVTDIAKIRRHPELAIVQHVDGFGTRSEKLATLHRVERRQFRLGFKLFYRQDIDRFTPRDVLRLRPTPDFISYQ